MVYKQSFQRLFDFLADGIHTEFIIKTFVDKIPMGIGKRMYHNLNKEKFFSIDEFISAFYNQLQSLIEVSLEITKLSSAIYDYT